MYEGDNSVKTIGQVAQECWAQFTGVSGSLKWQSLSKESKDKWERVAVSVIAHQEEIFRRTLKESEKLK
jgi:hypothetical protein